MTGRLATVEIDLVETDFTVFPERSILTYEDWRAYAARPSAVKPSMATLDEYGAMSQAEKKAFNQARTYFHNSFGPILVPAMEKIHSASLRLATQNLRAQPGARPGIIMDGISTVGKSTIAMQLGRRYERLATKNFTVTKTPDGNTYIPVVYINLPGECTIKNFNRILAKFYNIPHPKKIDEAFLTDQIKEYARDCGTSMVIVDDIHFLKMKNRSHATLNNHLKHLANSISATFIYAGIDCEGTGLLTEGSSVERATFSQTGHRFKKFDLSPYRYSTDKMKAEYLTVLSAFESNLILLKHPAKSLASELGEYIFARTGGFLGPISTLIREGASLAIKDKSERITLEILKKIKLDFDSEQRFKLYKKQQTAMQQKSALTIVTAAT